VADGQRVFAEVWNYSLRVVRERERKHHPELKPDAFEEHVRQKYGDAKEISPADLLNASKGLAPVPGAPTDPYSSPTVILHKGNQDRHSRETQMAAAEVALRRYGIEMPYGTCPEMKASLVNERLASRVEMLRAARRSIGSAGVVEVIFPAFNDQPLVCDAMKSHYKELLDAGVKVYEYTGKPMNHSKLEVADDVVVGGSSNMDARSWENDNENIFIVYDKALADAVWAQFEKDKQDAIEITDRVLKQREQGVIGLLRKWLEGFLAGNWVLELL
jgi:phosphatidylserine/phosphatidylglycerophosphate/cardiolipin synthase-like enzyme